MKYQSFLIKYAEIGIKGKNRHIFEEALVRQIKHALKPCEGNFAIHRTYGRVFVECLSEYDYGEVTEALSRVFGISGICPIKEMPVKPIEELREAAAAFMKEEYPDTREKAQQGVPDRFHARQRRGRRGGPHGLPEPDGGRPRSGDHAPH